MKLNGWGVIGLCVGLPSLVFWIRSHHDAQLCASAFVSALNPSACQTATTVHDLATVGLVVGVVAFIVNVIMASRGSVAR